MGFIQDENHFINYLKKIVRESNGIVDRRKLINIEMVIGEIYQTNLTDRFTWDVRTNPQILERDNFFAWLSKNKTYGYYIPSYIEHTLTAEAIERIETLDNIPGVYSFWSDTDLVLYIGTSINLGGRIAGSFSERFRNYNEVVFLKTIVTESASDAVVLESYFIAKYKPALNGAGKYDDILTISVSPEPEFTDSILFNRVT